MASRIELHNTLCGILGTRKVYFQPPESIKLEYPCFIYTLEGMDVKKADNKLYMNTNRYSILYIDRDHITDIPTEMLETFEMCSIDRIYTADNLYHVAFTLYF